jgi:hypothetical protein
MTKAKVIDREITTTASVKSIADAFRDGISQKPGGIWRMSAALLDWDFFTPDASSDPFAALDSGPAPTFVVAASYGLRGTPSTNAMRALSAGIGGAVVLSIWDEEMRRRVDLRHIGDASPASKKHVESIVERIRGIDPKMTLTQTEGKTNV